MKELSLNDNSSILQLNLGRLHSTHKSEILSAIEKVIEKSEYIGGSEVKKFESDFAKWVGEGSHVLGCANGTEAIEISARALHLKKDTVAILPAMTFFATAEALFMAGLKIKFVDIDNDTYVMDPKKVKSAVDTNTSLIVPVHLYGQMVDMESLSALSEQANLFILEDSSQSHGALWKNKPVGFWGDVATYSFYPGKNMGALGDGGAILSRDPNLISKAYSLCNHGGQGKYQHDEFGRNSRLDNLQAAVLNVKLKYIDSWNHSRRKVAQYYDEKLNNIKGLVLPKAHPSAKHVYHQYVVRVDKRDEFINYLNSHQIGTGIHYPKAMHEHLAFKNESFSKQSFPNAESLARHGLSLPMCPTLTASELEKIVTTIKRFFV